MESKSQECSMLVQRLLYTHKLPVCHHAVISHYEKNSDLYLFLMTVFA